MQDVISDNRFRGWGQSPSDPCGLTALQTVTEDVKECSPSNRVYKTAVYNVWTGVTCNPAGEVVCIHLPSFDIEGSASAVTALQGLPGLAYLNLADNKLTGELLSAVRELCLCSCIDIAVGRMECCSCRFAFG